MKIPVQQVKDLAPLIEKLAKARVVMLGESTHGTHEFYEWRRLISEWLIFKHGFRFIAIEGDWPEGERIHRFIHGTGADGALSSRQVLETFHRWPTWMWANTEILRLIDRLAQHNATITDPALKVGFYGLDLYSLFESIDEVLRFLERQAPLLARRARLRYACFDRFDRDEIAYARSTLHYPEGCAEEVIENLNDIFALRLSQIRADRGELFSAQQNARVVRDAENYYRAMVHGDVRSWNVRDHHMLHTLESTLKFHGPDSKAIVWAHNTHIGDYRATDMRDAGWVNLGGLARTHFGEDQVALVGFGTYQGTVTASHSWDGPMETMVLPGAASGSYEDYFHLLAESDPRFVLLFDEEARKGPLSEIKNHRAIGVVYDPEHEGRSNYVPTSLAKRYDAFFYIDKTHALEPLILPYQRGEFPETYPLGQ